MNIIESQRCFAGTVQTIEHDSKCTQTKMSFSLYLPDRNKEEPSSVVFFLAGLTCNHQNFFHKGHPFAKACVQNQILVACDTSPRGLELPGEHTDWDFGSGAGFYINATTSGYGKNYQMESYVADELYSLVLDSYSHNQKIGVMGHSMGGHGALTLGLKHPDKFQTISAFAPICHPSQAPWGQKAFQGYLGADKEEWKKHDAVELLRHSSSKQPILVEQGMADQFLQEQLQLEALKKVKEENPGLNLTIQEREGFDHSYYFIQSFIGGQLEFHLEG